MKKLVAMICAIVACILLCACGQKGPVAFTADTQTGESVYVDVVSIAPKHTLSSGTSITEVVCECTAISGETVWVCMSTSQYQRLDPVASFSSFSGNFYSGAFYPDGIRLRGRTISAENHVSGLAAMTAPVIIDFFEVSEEAVDPGSKTQPVQYADELSPVTPVYADIVSLEPFQLISDNSYHVQFVICMGITPSGESVPLYISIQDYRANFDPNADFSIFDVVSEPVELADTVRVYGLLVASENVAGDLSEDMPFNLLVFDSCETHSAQ